MAMTEANVETWKDEGCPHCTKHDETLKEAIEVIYSREIDVQCKNCNKTYTLVLRTQPPS